MLETLPLPWEAITAQQDRSKEDPRLSLISGQLGAWVPGGEGPEPSSLHLWSKGDKQVNPLSSQELQPHPSGV